MRWMRVTGLVIGFLFSAVFLFFFIGETMADRGAALHNASSWDIAMLIAGPFSLLLATQVSWKFERFAACWMLLGGVITAVLFGYRMRNSPMGLIMPLAVFVLPMVLCGVLWLRDTAVRAQARPTS